MNKTKGLTKSLTKSKTKSLTLTGLMTALMCVVSPVAIPLPFSPVPVSMTTFVVFLSVYMLGTRLGTAGCLVYLLIGSTGMPVFSNFTGGLTRLLGPTGGYLMSYVLMALVSGYLMQHCNYKKSACLVGMLLGTLVCYAAGTLWLAWQTGIGIKTAALTGIVPFMVGDILKIIMVLEIAPAIKKHINQI